MAVGDHLHDRALSGGQPPLEILVDLQNEHGTLPIDDAHHVRRAAQIRHPLENTGAVEPCQELSGRHAAVLVEDGVWHVIQVIGCRVAEYEPLHDRWNEQGHTRAAILQNGEQLLAGECDDAQDSGEHIGSQ